MDAEKRQRCLGALIRRKKDAEHWSKLEESMKTEGTQKALFTSKKERALEDIKNLQHKLGVS